MPPDGPRPTGGASRAVWVTRLRLGSGLVLFTYLTTHYDCQLVFSEEVARRAGADVAGFPAHELNLRGRVGRLVIRVVPDAQALGAVLGAHSAPSPVQGEGRGEG